MAAESATERHTFKIADRHRKNLVGWLKTVEAMNFLGLRSLLTNFGRWKPAHLSQRMCAPANGILLFSYGSVLFSLGTESNGMCQCGWQLPPLLLSWHDYDPSLSISIKRMPSSGGAQQSLPSHLLEHRVVSRSFSFSINCEIPSAGDEGRDTS